MNGLLDLLSKKHAWWLPPKSIRALFALIIVVAYVFDRVDPEVALAVLGYYFAAGQEQEI